MDKSLILKQIRIHLGFKKEGDFADYLDISQSTLSSWHKRNTFDYEKIIAKCKDIDANWLFSGEGSMLKPSKVENINFINEPTENYNNSYHKIEDHYTAALIDLIINSNLFQEKMKEFIKKEIPKSEANKDLNLINEIENMMIKKSVE